MADPLSIAASIAGLISLADTLFRHLYKFGRTAAGSKEEIQSMAAEVNDFSGVLRGLEALASELEAEGQTYEPTLRVHHLANCRQIFEKIQKRVKKAIDSFEKSRSKWEGIQRQLKWPFSVSETKDLLLQISHCKEAISLALSADTMRKLQLCLSRQEEQDGKLKKLGEGLERVEINTKILVDQRKQLTLNFFMKPQLNPQENLNQSLKLRQPLTGGWLISSYAFTEWLQTPGSRLWLNGIAGGGKTILAGAIIEEALKSATNSDVGVAFFFCDYKKEASLTPVSILGAIATQLALQRDDLFGLLQDYYNDLHPARELNKPADADELTRIIASMSELLPQVVIVVDGLDECGDNTPQVLECLSDLADCTSTTTIALLSRYEVDIQQVLRDEFRAICIEAHTEDLDIYVREEMERRIRRGQLSLQNVRIKEQIHEELVNRAHGMFRWVVCQLDYLGELVTDADRLLALKELPPTLSQTYTRLLQRMNRRPLKVQKMVQRCLQFIAFFPFELPIAALCQAVSIPETIGSYIDETNTISEREIALHCSSLIRKSADGENFEFAHFSVREFLENESLSQSPGLEMYRLSRPDSQVQLALQCLRFLQMKNFDQEPLGSFPEDDPQLVSYPFYTYATHAWLQLTKGGFHDISLINAAKSLFHSDQTLHFRFWIVKLLYVLVDDVISEEESSRSRKDILAKVEAHILDHSLGPLHVASALNLAEICSFLIDEGADVNAESPLGTPLLLANISVLGFLQDAVDHSLDDYWWVFEDLLPSSSQRNTTIDRLMSAGASFSRLDEYTGRHSVFSTAALIGCHLQDFSPVVTLLKHGTVPGDTDIDVFHSYLEASSNHDACQGMAEPLLGLFAYFLRSSAYNFDWGLSLGKKLWLAAVGLEFDFTNDPGVTDSRISLSLPALQEKTLLSIRNDDTATLQLCLKDGRVGLSDSLEFSSFQGARFQRGGTLLQHAAVWDAANCAALLLELGSDPNHQNETGYAVVHYCSVLGDGSVLKLLDKHGVSVLTPGPDNSTLWHRCAKGSGIPFLETLYDLDTESSHRALLMKTRSGNTPLMVALLNLAKATEESFSLMQDNILILIDYCQRTPHFWEMHESLFPTATKSGSETVVERLVELGVRPDAPNPGELTPLHDLGVGANYKWVELLTKLYPQALELRFEDRLPLELYIQNTLKAGKPPKKKVVEALVAPGIFKLKDNNGYTPWEFSCALKDQAQDWDAREEFLNTGWPNLDQILGDFVRLKAMEAYEQETGQCGIYLMLKSVWITNLSFLVSSNTLEEAITASVYWDPSQEVVVRFFKKAISFRDAAKVNVLLKHRFNIHQRESGDSSIEYACEPDIAGNLCSDDDGIALLQSLIDHADPVRLRDFSMDVRACSLLHRIACSENSQDIHWLIRQLIDEGADINAINPQAPPISCMSPLVWHLKWGSYDCAALLLELGADPLITGGQGDFWARASALEAALDVRCVWFLRKLLDHSKERAVELNWKGLWMLEVMLDGEGTRTLTMCTHLHDQCFKGGLECVKFLVDEGLIGDIDPVSGEGFTPLHCAAISGHADIIDFLISKGSSINALADDGRAGLHFAVINSNFESIKALVRSGALSLADSYSMTPRMYANELGHSNIVDFLSESFDDIDNSNRKAKLPPNTATLPVKRLKQAIRRNNMEECNRLLANGCPLNTPIPKFYNLHPLAFALARLNIRIAQWLLDNGARARARAHSPDDTYRSVLESASSTKRLLPVLTTVLHRYLENGGDWIHGSDAPLHTAIERKNLNSIVVILKHVGDNANRIGGMCQLRSEEVVSSVVNREFWRSWKSLGLRKLPALHFAVRKGNIAIASLLLENGADPDRLDYYGYCPLDYTEDPKMTILLLRSGASPIPILTENLDSLLSSWGSRSAALAKLYHDYYTKGLGIDLVDILGPAVPSDAYALHPNTCWAGYSLLLTMKSMGLGLENGSRHGNPIPFLLPVQDCSLTSKGGLETLVPFPWHRVDREGCMRFLGAIFLQYSRCLSEKTFTRWANLQPEQGWSPLCRAASQGLTKVMKKFLLMGAEIDFEGCPLGSALMIASACGNLAAVKLLVRGGAAVCYDGRRGPINVLSVTRSRRVRAWLLVGRFNDQSRIRSADDETRLHCERLTSCWSGIVQARFQLFEHAMRFEESTLRYAKRLGKLKRDLRGKILTGVDGFIYPQHSKEFAHGVDISDRNEACEEQVSYHRVNNEEDSSLCGGQHAASGAGLQGLISAKGTYHQLGSLGFTVTIGNRLGEEGNGV